MLGCNETLGVDDGNSVGIRLGTSLGKFETGASTVGDGTGAGVGSRSTHSFPSQQNPLPQSHTSTKSLSSIEQSQLRLLQVFGNGSVPSQQGLSVTIPPFSTQKLMTGESVGLGVVGISVPDGTGDSGGETVLTGSISGVEGRTTSSFSLRVDTSCWIDVFLMESIGGSSC